MLRRIIPLLFFLSILNAQIALPTFQAVHKPHSSTSSGSVTFTNCSATGRLGPTQSQVNSTYTSGNSLYGEVTINTQGIQEWTVPATTTYTIEAWGAQGGIAGDYNGGKGAYIKGDFSLTEGETIKIIVGQQGIGEAYQDDFDRYGGAGGGGGTFVVKTPFNNTSSILVIAGGGGGPTSYSDDKAHGEPGLTGTSGGDSGTPGGNGSGCRGPATGGSNGYGGEEGCAAGGGGFLGNGDDGGHYAFGGEAFINGGEGGNSTHIRGKPYGGFGSGGAGSPVNGYGGGGGGFSGGGGGPWTSSTAGNGGGGGSYNSSNTNTSSTEGSREDDGLVTITW